jgi:hypothetical protein
MMIYSVKFYEKGSSITDITNVIGNYKYRRQNTSSNSELNAR